MTLDGQLNRSKVQGHHPIVVCLAGDQGKAASADGFGASRWAAVYYRHERMDAPTPFLTLHLTPHGQLVAAREDAAPAINAAVAKRLDAAFAQGAGAGVIQLGASEVTTPLPATCAFWRAFKLGMSRPCAMGPRALHRPPSCWRAGFAACLTSRWKTYIHCRYGAC